MNPGEAATIGAPRATAASKAAPVPGRTSTMARSRIMGVGGVGHQASGVAQRPSVP